MRTTPLYLSVLLCSTLLSAQENQFKPAEQLQRYECLIGTWEGSGTIKQSSDLPESDWKSNSTYRWVLGDHFVREDTQISGDALPGTLHFVTYYGWDKENERYVTFSLTNMGTVETGQLVWLDDKTMVTGADKIDAGQIAVERWVSSFDAGKSTVTGHKADGAGDFYITVSGTGKRLSKKAEPVELTGTGFMTNEVGTAAKMKYFDGIQGSYRMGGTVIHAPGQPEVKIGGAVEVTSIFGNSIVWFHTNGDPMDALPAPYQDDGWIGWSAHDNCFKSVFVNNLGEAGVSDCRPAGDHKLIMTMSGLRNGQPIVARYVIEFDDSKAMTRMFGDSITADAKSLRDFDAKYEKKSAH